MQTRQLALLACLSSLVACGSDSTAPEVAVSGTVAFTYTGAGGGSYSATGSILSTASDATAQNTTWSTGWKDAADNSINVASNVALTATTSNFFGIVINRLTVGTATIDPNCFSTNTVSCTDVVLFTGFNGSSGSWTYLCSLESGSVTIATISSTKVTGSFSGTGTCVTGTTTSAFTVTNGSFDVPLLAHEPGS